MNDQKTENIIDMAVFKSESGPDGVRRDTLNKCRDLMTSRLSSSLSDMLDRADDLFFDLVQKSGPSDHHFYFDAMREVRLKRSSIESGFKESFADLYRKHLEAGENQQPVFDGEAEMDIEEALALNATVEKVKLRCQSTLLELDQHMHELLGEPDITRYNPIRPETVCHAFSTACDYIESGIEVKLILYKLFEKYVARDMDSIYTDMNSLLTESNANEKIRQNKIKNGSVGSQARPGNNSERQRNGIARDKNYFIVANRIIKAEISQHIDESTLPAFVKNFIYTQWSKLLLKIYIKEGVDSRAWLHAIEVIDDLVNCVGDSSSMKEKLMLSDVMPNLVQRLKFGMNVIPVKEDEGREFIRQLTQCHQELLDKARKEISRREAPEENSEDITVPSFRTTAAAKTPFMDELLVDNKPAKRNNFDRD